jgi:tRNA-splicing ligase RtcB
MTNWFKDPKIHHWLPEAPSSELRASVQQLARLSDVERIALMPDAHLAEHVCVGAVIATREELYPDAVGGDIGCGMAAVSLGIPVTSLDERRALQILQRLRTAVPTNRHVERQELPENLDPGVLRAQAVRGIASRDSRVEFATLGRGNHFVELQSDEDDILWVMLHSGSRAVGPSIRDYYRSVGERRKGGLSALIAESELGQAYLRDMQWAIEYAQHSRLMMLTRVLDAVATVLKMPVERSAEPITCTHNFVRRERHAGSLFWVHRKGAISAVSGEWGVIPGSMGSESFHVQGRGHEKALCSSSHGAGRKLSRAEAHRMISLRTLHQEMQGVWFDFNNADALCDEAPSAYKPIHKVMRAQRELTRIMRRLRPLLSYKGA